MKNLFTKRGAALVLCSMLSVHVVVAEVEYEFRIGASRSDNVARTATLEIEETIALVGLELNLKHGSRRVEASLVTDLEYRNYTDNTFDNEVVGWLDADLDLQLVPTVFSWVIQDRFGTLQTNPFQANTPINRQNVNRFSTGPDLRLRFGSNTAIEVGGRYYVNNFEISDIDSDILHGRLALVRALSPRRSLSLNVTADRIEFDNTVLNSNYDRQTAYIGFASENSRGSLIINIGYNELHDNGSVIDGNLVNVEWTRDLSPSTTFRLTYDQSLSDASDSFGRDQGSGPGFGNTPAGVADPFENRRFSAGFDYQRNNNSYFVSANFNKDEYVTASVLNRDVAGIRAGFSRVLGSAWRIRLDGALQRSDFVATGREDDDTIVGVGLSRQLTRTLAINLDFTRFDRDSSESTFDYVENLINLTISYGR